MYSFVEKIESKPYHMECMEILHKVSHSLKEKGISCSVVTIGSGARNLVTRNGDGAFDLDYNLEIVKCDDKYNRDLKLLKDTIRNTLNEELHTHKFSDAKDSTSVLTCIKYNSNNQPIFSIDAGIVKYNDNKNLMHLIHNKILWQEQFTWNEIPNSKDVSKKYKTIKKAGKFSELKEQYLKLKNQYLTNRDTNHPSYIIYVEAVNQVYNKL